MMSVKEVCNLSGVSARTLHYYDKIGLLKPSKVTDSGYRLYDEDALIRLQNILLFKELEFPLKEIKAILDSETFSPSEAIGEQIKLLELKRKKLGEIIAFARKMQKEGKYSMDFKSLKNGEFEKYKEEAKKKWGTSAQYKEYEQKSPDKSTLLKMNAIFEEFGTIKSESPDSDTAQQKVKKLQNFISENFYTCTDEILKSLGEMYVADGRFTENIDGCGGTGTAEFVRQAIIHYCSR